MQFLRQQVNVDYEKLQIGTQQNDFEDNIRTSIYASIFGKYLFSFTVPKKCQHPQSILNKISFLPLISCESSKVTLSFPLLFIFTGN